MNNIYLKGTGDFEELCSDEPTSEQILDACKRHPNQVAQNAIDSFSMEIKSALMMLAKFGDDDAMRKVLDMSAVDLIKRECV